jgi:hypothetical protein
MFEGVLATTPRVGQNAILSCIRFAYPSANEYGKARPDYPPLHFPGGVLIYSTGDPGEVDLDADVDRRFVRIRRRNIIAQAVSWAMAAQTGRYLSTDISKPDLPVYNAAMITDRLNRILDIEHYWEGFFDHLDVNPLELIYEDDIMNPSTTPQIAALRVLTYFELPYKTPLGPSEFEPFDLTLKHDWTVRYRNGHIPQPLRDRILNRKLPW